MQVGYRHKSRFWSNSWLSTFEDCWTCEVPKTFTDDEAEYDTVGHAPLAIDLSLDVQTTK